LESVKWAGEILIVDDFFTDRTVEICQSYGCRILQHSYENYAAQINWIIPLAGHDWVMVVDADERITLELQEEIQRILNDTPKYDGYIVHRSSLFIGKKIRYCGWQDDTVTRLFHRDKGRHQLRTEHSDIVIDRTTATLNEKLEHDTYQDFDEFFMKFKRYTDCSANDLYDKGIRAGFSNLILRPLFRFFKMYVLRFGFLDGYEGLILCGLSAFYVHA